jgi:hypothetical protein
MAITYPITLPTGGQRAVQFSPRSAVGVSASPYTFQQQAQAWPGQLWMARVTLAPMKRAAAEQWIAALLGLNGRYGTFHLGDPAATSPRGTPGASTPLVKGAAQTGQSLLTDGWTSNATGVLLRGDWIQLGSGSTRRIYKVLVDANANAGGEVTLDIWPRLRESPADNEAVVLTNTAGTFRLTSDESMSWDVDASLFYGLEFQAGEAI